MAKTSTTTPFLSDMQTLRARARAQIEDGAVTPAYGRDPNKTMLADD